MKRWYLIPLPLVAVLIAAMPVAALTETRLEQDLREELGLETRDCQPMTDLASPWSSQANLPYKLDEPRGAALEDQIYMLGGITGLEEVENGRLLLDASDELTRLDTEAETYTSLTPMPRRLNHIGVVAYRGDLSVRGG